MTADYIDGAQFLRPEHDVESWQHSRDPAMYSTSNLAWNRMNLLRGVLSWDDVKRTIKEGNLYAADRGCSAFVADLGGVVLYVIVKAQIEDYDEVDYDALGALDFDHTVVSIWAYVHDREEAWTQGRWNSNDLDKIEDMQPEYPDRE